MKTTKENSQNHGRYCPTFKYQKWVRIEKGKAPTELQSKIF